MHPYLRNLLILTFIGTVNFCIFMYISGRTNFFLGRSPTDVAQHGELIESGSDTLNMKDYSLKEILRYGGNVPSSVPEATSSNKKDDEVFIFRNTSNGTQVEQANQTENLRPSVKTDFINSSRQNSTVLNTVTHVRDSHSSVADRDDGTHINPHNYNLIMDEPKACYNDLGKPKDIFLVVLICTIHKNFEQRRAIRETWGGPKEIMGKKILTLFLLAYNKDKHLQRLVEEESQEHHDLLQEDFKDTYKNLTLKTMMGMKWASTHCGHASYLMKTDDDMYVGYANLIKYLSSPSTPSTGLAFGFRINGGPIRDPKSKWYMPKDKYPGSKYPPFLSGTGYVMSMDLAGKIYKVSLDTTFLYLEDVFVAVCLKSLNIDPKKHKDFNNWRTPYSYCRYRKLITAHMVPPTEMHRIWNDQQRQRSHVC